MKNYVYQTPKYSLFMLTKSATDNIIRSNLNENKTFVLFWSVIQLPVYETIINKIIETVYRLLNHDWLARSPSKLRPVFVLFIIWLALRLELKSLLTIHTTTRCCRPVAFSPCTAIFFSCWQESITLHYHSMMSLPCSFPCAEGCSL